MLSRINAWIVNRVARRAGGGAPLAAVEAEGLRVTDATAEVLVPWTEVQRIVAFTRPDEMGGAHGLAVECADGTVLELEDSVAAPDDTMATLGAHLPLEMSPNVWRARLLARPDAPVVLYDRSGGGVLEVRE